MYDYDDEIDYTNDPGFLEDDPAWMTDGKPFSFDLDDPKIELTEEEKAEEEAWLKGELDEEPELEKFDPNK